MYNILSMVSVVGVVVSFVVYIYIIALLLPKNNFLLYIFTDYGYYLLSRDGTNSMADNV